ncbi:MAG: leucine-rich repeat domain-containing protein, partial [Kiritimatiellae bacterium]|nr:leucine-rich repeat domain-containing protein [Kiritimatiellia bacterium]
MASGKALNRNLPVRFGERKFASAATPRRGLYCKWMILVTMIFFVVLPLMAATEMVGDYTWTYQINGDTAELSRYAVSPRPVGAITIPSTLGDRSVASIGPQAFYGYNNLTNVVIPSSVTNIGNNAFYRCSGLVDLTIPDSVTSIGTAAFQSCSSLTNVTIGGGVTSIGSNAFSGCSKLVSINVKDIAAWCRISFTSPYSNPLSYAHKLYLNNSLVTNLVIPESVTNIGNSAFYCCTTLVSVTIPDSVTSIGTAAFQNCSTLTNVAIGSGVTSIDNAAFLGCGGLQEFIVSDENSRYMSKGGLLMTKDGDTLVRGVNGVVTISDGVTSVDASAFQGCTGLVSVTIPDSVTSIGTAAFQSCSSLTNVTIGGGVTNMGNSAFSGCSTLAKVTIPDRVTSIGSAVFQNCSRLVNVTMGNRVRSIGNSSFYGCVGLMGVAIPNSVTRIDTNAFSQCTNLKSVMFKGDAPTASSAFTGVASGCTAYVNRTAVGFPSENVEWNGLMISYLPDDFSESNGAVFTIEDGVLTRVGWFGAADVTIPDGVTSISNNVFAGFKGLTSVTIPSSVANIGNYAFRLCSDLASVTFNGNAPRVGSGAFTGVAANCVAYVNPRAGGFSYQGAKWNGLTIAYAQVGITVATEMELPVATEMVPYSFQLTRTDGTHDWTYWDLHGSASYDVERSACSYSSVGEAYGSWWDTYGMSYDLPFYFPFYGTSYNHVYVNGNGTLSFDCECFGLDSSNVFQNVAMVAPFWSETVAFNDGDVYVEETDDYVTFRWSNHSNVNFSATLHSDGAITFSYGPGNDTGLVGISAGNGKDYTIVGEDLSMNGVDDITFRENGIAVGLSLSHDGLVSGIPRKVGTNQFELVFWDDEWGIGTNVACTLVVAPNANTRPVIDFASPSNSVIQIDPENETFFSVAAHDPEQASLSFSWYLDGNAVEGETTFSESENRWCSSIDYTPTSTNMGLHTVACVVSDGFWTNEVRRTWQVRVDYSNAQPVIDEYSPSNDTISVDLAYSALPEFFVVAHDPEGEPLSFIWYLDGIQTQAGMSSWNRWYMPTVTDVGTHTVACVVSDGFWTNEVRRTWQVQVENTTLDDVLLGMEIVDAELGDWNQLRLTIQFDFAQGVSEWERYQMLSHAAFYCMTSVDLQGAAWREEVLGMDEGLLSTISQNGTCTFDVPFDYWSIDEQKYYRIVLADMNGDCTISSSRIVRHRVTWTWDDELEEDVRNDSVDLSDENGEFDVPTVIVTADMWDWGASLRVAPGAIVRFYYDLGYIDDNFYCYGDGETMKAVVVDGSEWRILRDLCEDTIPNTGYFDWTAPNEWGSFWVGFTYDDYIHEVGTDRYLEDGFGFDVEVGIYHTVTFDPGEHGSWTSLRFVKQVVQDGASITRTPTVKADQGWAFVGWDKSFSNVKSDLTVTALYEWVGNIWTVTFKPGTHGTRIGGGALSQSVTNGCVAVKPTIQAKSGWRFTGWSGNVTAPIVSNATFTALYEGIPYNITYSNLKGATNPNPSTYTVEDAITFAAPGEVYGWMFKGWTPVSISVGSTGDRAVTASWERRKFDVTVNGETRQYSYEDEVTFTAPDPVETNGMQVIALGTTFTDPVVT